MDLLIWLHQVLIEACRIFFLIDLSSLTWDQTWAPCIAQSLNCWDTREVPGFLVFMLNSRWTERQ